jgi:hypothetical protein
MRKVEWLAVRRVDYSLLKGRRGSKNRHRAKKGKSLAFLPFLPLLPFLLPLGAPSREAHFVNDISGAAR